MPNYTYECADGHQHDKVVPIAERNGWRVCPTCGKVAQRITTSTNINVPGGTPTFYP